MATKLKIWDWTWFTWLADNNIIWTKWQYANESYNIDTQTEPNWVKLTPAITEYHTTTDKPTVILNLADYWKTWILTFTDDWKIYNNWTLIYTLATWYTIYDAVWQYNSLWEFYVLFFTKDWINRLDITDNSVDVDWKTFTSETLRKYPINVYWEIYFISEDKFYRLDNIWTLSSIYTFPTQDKVKWITFFQDNFNIYMSWWNYWRQYLFPILSTTPYYNIIWEWLPFLWVVNQWWLDYVVTWFNKLYSDLYLVSWTQRKSLKINWEWGNSRQFTWLLYTRLEDIYIWWEYKSNDRLYRFWNYYNWYAQELIPFLWWLDWEVKCINSSISALYIWTSANKVYELELNQPPSKYQVNWEIVSTIIDFWSPETKKFLNELHIAYEHITTDISTRWWTITLYARKWQTDNWTTIKTHYSFDDIWVVKVYAQELTTIWFWDFYQIQFKLKLESENDNTTTPFVKKVRVIYTDNLQA